MADVQLQGAGGNDADDGSTWTLAKGTLVSAIGVAGTGNTIWADSTQAETTGATQNVNAGTLTDPVKMISGTPDATTGVTAEAKGYAMTCSGGSFNITMNGWFYCKGFVFTAGAGGNNASINLAQVSDNTQRYKDCDFIIGGTTSTARITVGISSTSDSSRVVWDNCGVKFAAAGHGILVQNNDFKWNGGSVLAGGSTPSALFLAASASGRGSLISVTGVDFSNLASTFNFCSTPVGLAKMVIRGCKLPASWSGSLATGMLKNFRAEMYDCDTANNGYVRFNIKDNVGDATQETTIDRTGVGDGVGDYSIKIVTGANAEFPVMPFVSHEQFKWNASTGVSKTLTIELASNAALTNKDVVVRARYYGSAGSPIMSEVTNEPTVIAAATALTTSAAGWNSAPTNKYKVELTFTPQRAGYVVWDVLVYAPSTTLYVSPGGVIS